MATEPLRLAPENPRWQYVLSGAGVALEISIVDHIEKRRVAKEDLARNLTIAAMETDPSPGVLAWLITTLDQSNGKPDWNACVSFWQSASQDELRILSVMLGWVEPQGRRPGETLPQFLYESHCRLEEFVKKLLGGWI